MKRTASFLLSVLLLSGPALADQAPVTPSSEPPDLAGPATVTIDGGLVFHGRALPCAAIGTLAGPWQYGNSEVKTPGTAQITQSGTAIEILARWAPNPAPGWHY